jgi:CheY-like chemotaxis protein
MPEEPLRVLVAEDNDFNAQLIEQLLIRRGHHVSLARNGREALAQLEDSPFELLMLDIHMPELDGFDVTHAIRHRERETGGHLPVIALTARSRSEDRDRCLSAGMDEFLTKPFRADDLWTVIDRALGRRRQVAPTNEETSQARAALDPAKILAACGGDESLLRKICHSFRERIPEHLATVEDALRQQDAPRLREAAHKICGMIATFSVGAGDVASKLEESAARGDLEECRLLVQRLVTIASSLVESVSGLSVEALRSPSDVCGNAQANSAIGQIIGPVG